MAWIPTIVGREVATKTIELTHKIHVQNAISLQGILIDVDFSCHQPKIAKKYSTGIKSFVTYDQHIMITEHYELY